MVADYKALNLQIEKQLQNPTYRLRFVKLYRPLILKGYGCNEEHIQPLQYADEEGWQSHKQRPSRLEEESNSKNSVIALDLLKLTNYMQGNYIASK